MLRCPGKIKFSKNVRCFTEQGVAMFTPLNAQPVYLGLSSVLRSKRAIQACPVKFRRTI